MGVPQLRVGGRRLPGGVRFRQGPDGGDQRVAHQLQIAGRGQLPGAGGSGDQFGVLLCPGLSTPADGYFLRRRPGPARCHRLLHHADARGPQCHGRGRLHPGAHVFPGRQDLRQPLLLERERRDLERRDSLYPRWHRADGRFVRPGGSLGHHQYRSGADPGLRPRPVARTHAQRKLHSNHQRLCQPRVRPARPDHL